jgi:two-component system CitB family response regulator
VTAGELAEQTGLSRVSARRYLELLVHEGLVEMRPRYGEAGRPQHEYRWGAGS